MQKKFFSFMGALALICFSFYYTDSAVDIVKRNDPIMKEIVESANAYEKGAIDAILIDNNIIPGVNGVKVNIDRSYEKMKKYGSFDASLFVFEEDVPAISTTNTYNKFIIKGNSIKQAVTLLFKFTDTTYLDDILAVLKDKQVQATFFIHQDILYNDYDALKKIYVNGHAIEILSSKYEKDEIKKINKTLTSLLGIKVNYCYTEIENDMIIKNCQKNTMHSVIPTIITDSFPYNSIKNNVVSGSIISMSHQLGTVRELSSIINYLNQKGYQIMNLDELLEE